MLRIYVIEMFFNLVDKIITGYIKSVKSINMFKWTWLNFYMFRNSIN